MYSRICIFGRPGSGKSTFAYKLHQKINVPLYHLDKYFYISNWTERDYGEFLKAQQEIVNTDQWIIDGNSLKSLEMRYARAQVCIYFNYSRLICLWRLFKRRFFTKNRAIQDRAEGCPEMLQWCLLKYMWTFEYRLNKRLLHDIADLCIKYPQVIFIEVRNDNDLKKLSLFFGYNE